MGKSLVFNLAGYDPFIDFIKAYAIICVLLGHTIQLSQFGYGLWAGMQVPLFILVQAFHFYKKDDAKLKVNKLLQRIVLPFLLFGLFELVCFYFVSRGDNGKYLIIKWLKGGGDTAQEVISHLYIYR